jgi:alpha-amylase/alpha-mannosidase (GH57 family)
MSDIDALPTSPLSAPASAKLDLLFLWHMHQPDYRDTTTGEFRLPWVLLHALKDYSDMAGHYERHPSVRGVVNFVPVLLDQIEDYADQFASGHLRDPLLRLLACESPETLDLETRRFALDACFKCNADTMITPYTHYRTLREMHQLVSHQGETVLGYFAGSYFSDLVTWYHLAWTGETVRRSSPLIAELMAKGQGYTLADRQALLALIGEVISGLIPRYRALAERGQIELSSTPHDHPLAPLLIDFRSTLEAMPGAPLPSCQHYHGGTLRAARHVQRARNSHARRFGAPPVGMWPAEGALSAPFLRVLAEQKVAWAASSEAVLANSLRRNHDPLPEREHRIYRPWRFDAGHAGEIQLFFRDEPLSDQIGFEYSRWHGDDAAADFVARVQDIRSRAPAGDTPLVCVMLDGENAWEYYPYNGFYFFEALYGQLAATPDVATTTCAEACQAHAARTLPLADFCAGSWVYGTFSTWIGSTVKNHAWDLLCDAKQSFDLVTRSGRLGDDEALAAEAQLAICESSDWFWWMGDYNPGDSVESFDRLYRENLRRLYRLLQLTPPVVLNQPISLGGGNAEGGGSMRRAG